MYQDNHTDDQFVPHKMEDECSIGNDETRCFILSSFATNKMNRVPCVLCNCMMNIFER